jgi:hypothetical protein
MKGSINLFSLDKRPAKHGVEKDAHGRAGQLRVGELTNAHTQECCTFNRSVGDLVLKIHRAV